MAKFRGAVISCEVCGRETRVPPSRAKTARFCSVPCAAVVRNAAMRKRVTLRCAACGRYFEERPCHADRRRYCSNECRNACPDYRSEVSARTYGEGNAMWKGGVTRHKDGYLYEWAPEHPFASNRYVFQHRLVMERWLRENDPSSSFLIKLGGQLYLSPEFEVHHKDEDRTNNQIDNLECLTPSEHASMHNRMRVERGEVLFCAKRRAE